MALVGPAVSEARAPSRQLALTCAFQPIVDIRLAASHSFEALIRGPDGQSAAWVLQRAPEDPLEFDLAAWRAALTGARELGLEGSLNLNCSPVSIARGGLRHVLALAERLRIDPACLVCEVTETAAIDDGDLFVRSIEECRAAGVRVAIDDFGAGHSGLNLLARFQPDEVKLDMQLIRDIDREGPKQAIVRAVGQMCEDLAIDVVAEGVETMDEFAFLRDTGISLFQGFLFARPGWRSLPRPVFPR